MANLPMPTFKVILMGPAEVGKTHLVIKTKGVLRDANYVPTLGLEVHPLVFRTNNKTICLNIWDCGGDPRFRGLGIGYTRKAQAFMFMFDLRKEETFTEMNELIDECYKKEEHEDVPIVIIGTNVDNKSFDPEYDEAYPYFEIDINENITSPFLDLVRGLMEDETIEFV